MIFYHLFIPDHNSERLSSCRYFISKNQAVEYLIKEIQQPQYILFLYYFPFIFSQLSFNDTVRLKINLPGSESLSTQKYPVR